MKPYLILYIPFIVALIIEATIIDPLFWKNGKSDKPWSTLIYMIVCLVVFLISNWISLVIGFMARASLYDPLLNKVRKLDICYHPNKNQYERFWRMFSCPVELGIRIGLLVLPIGLVLLLKHFSLI